jgi:hypothetical protein
VLPCTLQHLHALEMQQVDWVLGNTSALECMNAMQAMPMQTCKQTPVLCQSIATGSYMECVCPCMQVYPERSPAAASRSSSSGGSGPSTPLALAAAASKAVPELLPAVLAKVTPEELGCCKVDLELAGQLLLEARAGNQDALCAQVRVDGVYWLVCVSEGMGEHRGWLRTPHKAHQLHTTLKKPHAVPVGSCCMACSSYGCYQQTWSTSARGWRLTRWWQPACPRQLSRTWSKPRQAGCMRLW